MFRVWIGVGGVFGAAAVGMAAVAAHALGGLTPPALHVVESGLQMQGWHALALLACGVWAERFSGRSRRLAHAAGAAFAVGLVLFCTAAYAFGLEGVSFGPVAPVGGLLLIAGWLLLAASALGR